MDAAIINPFVESTVEVAETMAQLSVAIGKAQLKENNNAQGEVTGIIELASQKHHGSLAITFEKAALLLVYKKMLGETLESLDDSALDLAGEITNMVCGSAKQKLSLNGYDFDLTQPSILTGKNYQVEHKWGGPVLTLPLQLDEGIIYIEVSLKR